MKIKLPIPKFVLLLICAGCIFMLSQCSKSDLFVPYAPYAPATPRLSDHSSIAFIARTTYNSADWSLYIMDKSGNNARRLFNRPVACRAPIRSHCGTKLLFIAETFNTGVNNDNSVWFTLERELYIINTDGTNRTLIDRIGATEVGNFGGASWSPCERFIIYVRGCSDNAYLIRYCISSNTRAILPTEGNVCSPQFSPCGRYIAYCATAESDITDMTLFHNHNIHIMDINGNNSRLIIRNAGTPRWSPQGNRIAYLAVGQKNSPQIFVANTDGSNQRQLTHSIYLSFWGSANGNRDPQWTPDGKRIVYVSWENTRPEIFIMNSDGSNQTRLTTAEFGDKDPEITPDGNFILFSSTRTRTVAGAVSPAIYIMTLDGKDERQLWGTGIHPIALR